MDAEADSQRGEQSLHTDILMDVGELHDEECGTKMLLQEPNGSVDKGIQHTESSSLFPAYPVCVPHDRWTMSGEKEDVQDNLLHSYCTAGGSRGQRSPSPMLKCWVCPENQHNVKDSQVKKPVNPSVSPHLDMPHLSISISGSVSAVACPEVSDLLSDTSSPFGCLCSLNSSSWDALGFPSRSPGFSNQDPVSAAAHLHLLGESLSLIGHHLKETNKTVCMSSSFSLLLDSLLCALGPLMCLTAQIPEMISCTEYTLASTLENIAYVMPGL
ncbi:uncharacterized protein LOC121638231 [Melanotaenia boesemani]|uniref:uncharacterized protein LOC121638231 n=1 Tax=Melanotaenia boesemani TaxID=1250792 RepID=UPI001C040E5A|nr:uncharacterized protein LOC121638231 [Melanotaenia boesemani]